MEILFIIFIVIIILIIVILGIILYLYHRVKSAVGSEGLSMLKDVIRNNQDYAKEHYSMEKSISGMTNIYEPLIRKDFNDFNLELFFNNIEKNINNFLNCLMNKDSRFINKDLILIKGTLKKKIQDMKDRDINVSYHDIVFHKHAIKNYYKRNGAATIVTNSSVGYYYDTNQSNKKHYQDTRKETKYLCEFVYVYDENKFDSHVKSLGLHCPNCGAPIEELGNLHCHYCGSQVKAINLKNWLIANIKEIDTNEDN